jgi:uncharacterized membrane protein
LIIGLSIVGILLSVVTAACVDNHIERPEHAKLFGVHWSAIGIIGYAAMAATVSLPVLTEIFAVIAGLVTVWLAYRWVKLRVDCPFCPVAWVVNAVIVIVVFV